MAEYIDLEIRLDAQKAMENASTFADGVKTKMGEVDDAIKKTGKIMDGVVDSKASTVEEKALSSMFNGTAIPQETFQNIEKPFTNLNAALQSMKAGLQDISDVVASGHITDGFASLFEGMYRTISSGMRKIADYTNSFSRTVTNNRPVNLKNYLGGDRERGVQFAAASGMRAAANAAYLASLIRTGDFGMSQAELSDIIPAIKQYASSKVNHVQTGMRGTGSVDDIARALSEREDFGKTLTSVSNGRNFTKTQIENIAKLFAASHGFAAPSSKDFLKSVDFQEELKLFQSDYFPNRTYADAFKGYGNPYSEITPNQNAAAKAPRKAYGAIWNLIRNGNQQAIRLARQTGLLRARNGQYEYTSSATTAQMETLAGLAMQSIHDAKTSLPYHYIDPDDPSKENAMMNRQNKVYQQDMEIVEALHAAGVSPNIYSGYRKGGPTEVAEIVKDNPAFLFQEDEKVKAKKRTHNSKTASIRTLGTKDMFVIPQTRYDEDGNLIVRDPSWQKQNGVQKQADDHFITVGRSALTDMLGMTGANTYGYGRENGKAKYGAPKLFRIDTSDLYEVYDREDHTRGTRIKPGREKEAERINKLFNRETTEKYGDDEYIAAYMDGTSLTMVRKDDYDTIVRNAKAAGLENPFDNMNIGGRFSAGSYSGDMKAINLQGKMATPGHRYEDLGYKKAAPLTALVDFSSMYELAGVPEANPLLRQNSRMDGVTYYDPRVMPFNAQMREGLVDKYLGVREDWRKLLFAGGYLENASKSSQHPGLVIKNPNNNEYGYSFYMPQVGLGKERVTSLVSEMDALQRKVTEGHAANQDTTQEEARLKEIRDKYFYDVMDPRWEGIMSDTAIKNDDKWRLMRGSNFKTMVSNGTFEKDSLPASIIGKSGQISSIDDISDDDVVELTALQQARHLQKAGEMFGVWINNTSDDFRVKKDFIPESLATAMGLGIKERTASAAAYSDYIKALQTDEVAQQEYLASMPLGRMLLASGQQGGSLARKLIGARITDLEESRQQGHIFMPGNDISIGLTAPKPGSTINPIFQGLFGVGPDNKTEIGRMLQTTADQNSVIMQTLSDEEVAGLKGNAAVARMMLSRMPAAPGEYAPDSENLGDVATIRRAMSMLGMDTSSTVFTDPRLQYKLMTGDYDGDTAWVVRGLSDSRVEQLKKIVQLRQKAATELNDELGGKKSELSEKAVSPSTRATDYQQGDLQSTIDMGITSAAIRNGMVMDDNDPLKWKIIARAITDYDYSTSDTRKKGKSLRMAKTTSDAVREGALFRRFVKQLNAFSADPEHAENPRIFSARLPTLGEDSELADAAFNFKERSKGGTVGDAFGSHLDEWLYEQYGDSESGEAKAARHYAGMMKNMTSAKRLNTRSDIQEGRQIAYNWHNELEVRRRAGEDVSEETKNWSSYLRRLEQAEKNGATYENIERRKTETDLKIANLERKQNKTREENDQLEGLRGLSEVYGNLLTPFSDRMQKVDEAWDAEVASMRDAVQERVEKNRKAAEKSGVDVSRNRGLMNRVFARNPEAAAAMNWSDVTPWMYEEMQKDKSEGKEFRLSGIKKRNLLGNGIEENHPGDESFNPYPHYETGIRDQKVETMARELTKGIKGLESFGYQTTGATEMGTIRHETFQSYLQSIMRGEAAPDIADLYTTHLTHHGYDAVDLSVEEKDGKYILKGLDSNIGLQQGMEKALGSYNPSTGKFEGGSLDAFAKNIIQATLSNGGRIANVEGANYLYGVNQNGQNYVQQLNGLSGRGTEIVFPVEYTDAAGYKQYKRGTFAPDLVMADKDGMFDMYDYKSGDKGAIDSLFQMMVYAKDIQQKANNWRNYSGQKAQAEYKKAQDEGWLQYVDDQGNLKFKGFHGYDTSTGTIFDYSANQDVIDKVYGYYQRGQLAKLEGARNGEYQEAIRYIQDQLDQGNIDIRKTQSKGMAGAILSSDGFKNDGYRNYIAQKFMKDYESLDEIGSFVRKKDRKLLNTGSGGFSPYSFYRDQLDEMVSPERMDALKKEWGNDKEAEAELSLFQKQVEATRNRISATEKLDAVQSFRDIRGDIRQTLYGTKDSAALNAMSSIQSRILNAAAIREGLRTNKDYYSAQEGRWLDKDAEQAYQDSLKEQARIEDSFNELLPGLANKQISQNAKSFSALTSKTKEVSVEESIQDFYDRRYENVQKYIEQQESDIEKYDEALKKQVTTEKGTVDYYQGEQRKTIEALKADAESKRDEASKLLTGGKISESARTDYENAIGFYSQGTKKRRSQQLEEYADYLLGPKYQEDIEKEIEEAQKQGLQERADELRASSDKASKRALQVKAQAKIQREIENAEDLIEKNDLDSIYSGSSMNIEDVANKRVLQAKKKREAYIRDQIENNGKDEAWAEDFRSTHSDEDLRSNVLRDLRDNQAARGSALLSRAMSFNTLMSKFAGSPESVQMPTAEPIEPPTPTPLLEVPELQGYGKGRSRSGRKGHQIVEERKEREDRARFERAKSQAAELGEARDAGKSFLEDLGIRHEIENISFEDYQNYKSGKKVKGLRKDALENIDTFYGLNGAVHGEEALSRKLYPAKEELEELYNRPEIRKRFNKKELENAGNVIADSEANYGDALRYLTPLMGDVRSEAGFKVFNEEKLLGLRKNLANIVQAAEGMGGEFTRFSNLSISETRDLDTRKQEARAIIASARQSEDERHQQAGAHYLKTKASAEVAGDQKRVDELNAEDKKEDVKHAQRVKELDKLEKDLDSLKLEDYEEQIEEQKKDKTTRRKLGLNEKRIKSLKEARAKDEANVESAKQKNAEITAQNEAAQQQYQEDVQRQQQQAQENYESAVQRTQGSTHEQQIKASAKARAAEYFASARKTMSELDVMDKSNWTQAEKDQLAQMHSWLDNPAARDSAMDRLTGMYEQEQLDSEGLLADQRKAQLASIGRRNEAALRQDQLAFDRRGRQRARYHFRGHVARSLFDWMDTKDSLSQKMESQKVQKADLEAEKNIRQKALDDYVNRTVGRGNESKLNGDSEYERLKHESDLASKRFEGLNASLEQTKGQLEEVEKPGAGVAAIFKGIGGAALQLGTRLARQTFQRALQETKRFVKEYDKSMTDIQMITLKSNTEMSTLGTGLLNKASDLKVSFSDVASSATALYRQGLSDSEVNSRLDTIMKFSRVSGTKVDAATKLLTIATNTGLVEDAAEAADIVTALGDNAATNASEIEKGIEKAGAAAAADGTTFGQLAAMLTAITSTTQIGGNVAGRTINTIFGRMNKVGTSELIYDENGNAISGSAVAQLLSAQGIDTYRNGQKRSTFDVLYDLSKGWDSISDAEQQQIANAIAGTRQYSNFAAIMQGMQEGDIDEYLDLISESDGIVNKKYSSYSKSLEASKAKLQTNFDKVIQGITQQIDLPGFYDFIARAIEPQDSDETKRAKRIASIEAQNADYLSYKYSGLSRLEELRNKDNRTASENKEYLGLIDSFNEKFNLSSSGISGSFSSLASAAETAAGGVENAASALSQLADTGNESADKILERAKEEKRKDLFNYVQQNRDEYINNIEAQDFETRLNSDKSLSNPLFEDFVEYDENGVASFKKDTQHSAGALANYIMAMTKVHGVPDWLPGAMVDAVRYSNEVGLGYFAGKDYNVLTNEDNWRSVFKNSAPQREDMEALMAYMLHVNPDNSKNTSMIKDQISSFLHTDAFKGVYSDEELDYLTQTIAEDAATRGMSAQDILRDWFPYSNVSSGYLNRVDTALEKRALEDEDYFLKDLGLTDSDYYTIGEETITKEELKRRYEANVEAEQQKAEKEQQKAEKERQKAEKERQKYTTKPQDAELSAVDMLAASLLNDTDITDLSEAEQATIYNWRKNGLKWKDANGIQRSQLRSAVERLFPSDYSKADAKDRFAPSLLSDKTDISELSEMEQADIYNLRKKGVKWESVTPSQRGILYSAVERLQQGVEAEEDVAEEDVAEEDVAEPYDLSDVTEAKIPTVSNADFLEKNKVGIGMDNLIQLMQDKNFSSFNDFMKYVTEPGNFADWANVSPTLANLIDNNWYDKATGTWKEPEGFNVMEQILDAAYANSSSYGKRQRTAFEIGNLALSALNGLTSETVFTTRQQRENAVSRAKKEARFGADKLTYDEALAAYLKENPEATEQGFLAAEAPEIAALNNRRNLSEAELEALKGNVSDAAYQRFLNGNYTTEELDYWKRRIQNKQYGLDGFTQSEKLENLRTVRAARQNGTLSSLTDEMLTDYLGGFSGGTEWARLNKLKISDVGAFVKAGGQNKLDILDKQFEKYIEEQQELLDIENNPSAYGRAMQKYRQNNKAGIAANEIYESLSNAEVKNVEDLLGVLSNKDNAKNWEDLLESSPDLAKKLNDLGLSIDKNGEWDVSGLQGNADAASAALASLAQAVASVSTEFDKQQQVYSTGEKYNLASQYLNGTIVDEEAGFAALNDVIGNAQVAQIARNNYLDYTSDKEKYDQAAALYNQVVSDYEKKGYIVDEDGTVWDRNYNADYELTEALDPLKPGSVEYNPYKGMTDYESQYAQTLFENARLGVSGLTDAQRYEGLQSIVSAAEQGGLTSLYQQDRVGAFADYTSGLEDNGAWIGASLALEEVNMKMSDMSGLQKGTEAYETASKAVSKFYGSVENAAEAQKDMDTRLKSQSMAAMNAYGKSTSNVADLYEKLKGTKADQLTARQAIAANRTNLSRSTYYQGRFAEGKVSASSAAEYVGMDKKYAQTKEGKEELKKQLDLKLEIDQQAVMDDVNAQLQTVIDDLGGMENVNLGPIKIGGTYDISELSGLASEATGSAREIINSLIQSLAGMEGHVTFEASADGKTITVKSSDIKTAGGGSGGGGGGGGGKSAIDTLLERQKHEVAEQQHEIKMTQIQEAHYERLNEYDKYIDTLDEEIAKQTDLRDVYARHLKELQDMMSGLEEYSDDWWKAKEAIAAAEEAIAEYNNTVAEIDAKKIQAISTKQENQDKPGSHRTTMFEKRAQYYMDRGQFENYAVLVEKQVAQMRADISLNDKQISEWEGMLTQYVEKSKEWEEVRDKIFAIQAENADLENQAFEKISELNQQRISQIQTDYQNEIAPIEHEQNMLDIWGNIYQNEGRSVYYDENGNKHTAQEAYRNTLAQKSEYNTRIIAETKEAIAALEAEMKTLDKGSEAWLQARDALNQLNETVAQATLEEQEYTIAIQESLIAEQRDKYDSRTKDLEHEMNMLQKMQERYEKNNDYVNSEDTLALITDQYDTQIELKKQELADAEALWNSGKLTGDQWQEEKEHVMELREQLQGLVNDEEEAKRNQLKTRMEHAQEQYDHENGLTQHQLKLVRYEETRYQNSGQLTNYKRMLEVENGLLDEEQDSLRNQIGIWEELLAEAEPGSDLYYEITKKIYELEEALKSSENQQEKVLENQKKVEESILKVHKNLISLIDNELKTREKERRERLSAEVSIQNQILNLIRNRYKQEWAIIKADIDKKKQALQEEKALINERLNARLNAEKEEERYTKLSELQRQLTLISADPTRTKDAIEIMKQIEDIQKEIANETAQQEVNAAGEQLDDQTKAYDEYAKYSEERLNEWLKDANNLQEELDAVLGDSDAPWEDRFNNYMDWIKQNDENYKYGTEAMRLQLEQNNQDSWKKMVGFIDTYWDQVNDIIDGGIDRITEFMKESTSYIYGSDVDQRLAEIDWSNRYEADVKATIDDAVFNDIHELVEYMSELQDNTYKVEPTPDFLMKYGLYDSYLKYMYERDKSVSDEAKNFEITDYAGIGKQPDPEPAPSSSGSNSSGSGNGGSGNSGSGKGKGYRYEIEDNGTTINIYEGGQYETWHDAFEAGHNEAKKVREAYKQQRAKTREQLDNASENLQNTISKIMTNLGISVEKPKMQFASGGLVDFTGPAWVDGTKTRPESFLDATDTENVRAMLDALNYVQTMPMLSPSEKFFGNSSTVGDINIVINQAELKSDADYDEVARRVGQAFTKQLSKDGFQLSGYNW